MILSDFIEACQCGSFINYDGCGRYAFYDKMSNKYVHPSDVVNDVVDYSYTHVMWFNK